MLQSYLEKRSFGGILALEYFVSVPKLRNMVSYTLLFKTNR